MGDKKVNMEKRIWGMICGGFSAACLHTGDKLGLFKIIHEDGPLTLDSLEQILTKDNEGNVINKRVLKEWLMQTTAAGILEFDNVTENFSLTSDIASYVLDPRHPDGTNSMIGALQAFPILTSRISNLSEQILNTCQNNLDYTSFGSDVAEGIERMHWVKFQTVLCQKLLKSSQIQDGNLYTKLANGGAIVADIGCGGGGSTRAMAKHFPKSEFHAYELSKSALKYFAQLTDEEKERSDVPIFENLFLHDVMMESYNEKKFDMVFCYDLIHDLSDPEKFVQQIKSILKPDGVFVIVDIICHKEQHKNLSLAGSELRYGFSCGLCLHSGLTDNGKGLGTMGLYPELLKEWANKHGFSKFKHFILDELSTNFIYCIEH